MSRLTDRLKRLDRPVAPTRPVDTELHRRLDRLFPQDGVRRGVGSPPPPPTEPLEAVVPGRRLRVGDNPVYCTDWTSPPRHGTVPSSHLGILPSPGARALFPREFACIDRSEQIAYLDTETTGLSGGAGTIPFLVGVGRWVPGRGFLVRQFFLEDLDREGALLDALGAHLEGVRCLVTYNGRAYDLPLLENRHVLCHRRWPLGDASHLDLLPPARTLWRHSHPNCRLTTLEASLLGVTRRGDVPGAEIPGVYRDYLRRGAADERLARVFHHNRLDIVSLAGLLWLAGETADRTEGPTALGVAKLHHRAGRTGPARQAWRSGLAADLPRAQRLAALKQLALTHKRSGEWHQALARWDEMIALAPSDLHPVEEAAKALEHRLGDPAGALARVDAALARGPWLLADAERLKHRRRRLQRKIARAT